MVYVLLFGLIAVLSVVADHVYCDGKYSLAESKNELMMACVLMAVPVLNLLAIILILQCHYTKGCVK